MRILSLLFFLSICNFCVAQQSVSIIPQPVSLQIDAGSFTINAKTAISIDGNKALTDAAVFLKSTLNTLSGYELPLKAAKTNSIVLMIAKLENTNEEGYQLLVTPTKITIKANTKAGIVYGIQSLLQMLPAVRTNASLSIPCLSITDYPRFKWRGMHLDVSRHFFGPEVIKHYIDLMASYKMNVFHWHLVDDTGWRIEIKKYPNLIQTGAWRVDQTDKVWGSRPQAKTNEIPTYGGFYTQKQISEIIKYASERNVTIVP